MKYGADYYPEHWPEERWETDARLMQEAGFNIVRLAEFAWIKMEPSEGNYDFSWLLKAMDILHKHGIQSVIGTPTATPPAWLIAAKPEILKIDENRVQTTFGNRQFSCINQPAYLEASDKIVTAMAKALGKLDEVYGWQLDNEFGPLCYCEVCRKKFQDWVKAKYVTLSALEDAWGTIFWSQTYTDWSQIPLPWNTSNAPNPSLALDYKRFFSECYADYAERQAKIIRQYSDKPITHNFMGFWPEVLNYQLIADKLDFCAWDSYPFGGADPAIVAAGHDIVRGYMRKNFWVMEQMSGPGGWGEMSQSPKPGRVREWAYQAIARGADTINYFRWRVCRYGTEQYWHGILNHDGSTNRRYEEIKNTRDELKRFEHLIDGTTVKADVALLNDYDSRFAFQFQKSNHQLSYINAGLSVYKPFFKRNISVDILSNDKAIGDYKVLLAPAHFVLTAERAEKLKEYVRNGGTLVMTYRCAVKDDTGLIYNEPLPGRLQDVFGATVKEYHSPWGDEINKITGAVSELKDKSGDCNVWLDLMDAATAEVLAEYGEGFIPGEAAVTRNKFGEGTAYYIGTQTDQDFMDALMAMVISDAEVECGLSTPDGVEAAVRSGKDGDLTFLINHTSDEQEVMLPGKFDNLVTGNSIENTIKLPLYGVAVLK